MTLFRGKKKKKNTPSEILYATYTRNNHLEKSQKIKLVGIMRNNEVMKHG